MLTGRQPVALSFGVSKMSSDPSQQAHQQELLDMVQQKNIKLLDTARHYVSSSQNIQALLLRTNIDS
jgi:hypothetical protein